MLLEILFFLFLGILTGTLTGLIPGIHINLIGAGIVSLSAIIFYTINPIYLVVFIVSMAITHTFVDFIPSIFLGCPDTDTELSILPGHQLLKNGEGYEAILLTCYGSLAAVIALVIIAFPSIILISKTYESLKIAIPFVLIAILFFLIFTERKKTSAFFVLLLTGILGFSVLNLGENSEVFLLPLLTGLFGASMLIISIKTKIQIPKQKITNPNTNITKPFIGALIASPICSFLPGIGSGQAAILGNSISKTDIKGFLVLLGATNTLVMGFSFISLYVIFKTRTGAAAAVQDLIGVLSWQTLCLILIVALISGVISFFITKSIAKKTSEKLEKINYTKISIITLTFITILVFLVSGFLGLFIFIISTVTGIYSISLGVRRTNMMGCLLIPTIIFYLFAF
ncbi:MAG: tripartite tricarboxylate transporter permease [Candidatus Pacearchaeota archaeon]